MKIKFDSYLYLLIYLSLYQYLMTHLPNTLTALSHIRVSHIPCLGGCRSGSTGVSSSRGSHRVWQGGNETL